MEKASDKIQYLFMREGTNLNIIMAIYNNSYWEKIRSIFFKLQNKTRMFTLITPIQCNTSNSSQRN